MCVYKLQCGVCRWWLLQYIVITPLIDDKKVYDCHYLCLSLFINSNKLMIGVDPGIFSLQMRCVDHCAPLVKLLYDLRHITYDS